MTSPTQQEAMAVWVEGIFASFPRLLAQESAWLSQHPDDLESRGRVQYYRHAISVSRQIAYYIRTFRIQRGDI